MRLDIILEKNYLMFPIRLGSANVRLHFFDGEHLLGSYDLPYTEANPDAAAYLDIRRLKSRLLRIETSSPVYLRQVDQQTVPLLDPSREPVSPGSLPTDVPQIGSPIFRADTFYKHYAYTPVSICRHETCFIPSSAYLVLPVREDAPPKLLRFFENGRLLAEYRVKLCTQNPDFLSYLDIRRWIGHSLTLESSCEVPIRQAKQIDFPDLYREENRPLVHFTVKNGWNNDPNGLIFLNGIYHMFYQYGPCSVHWNNMHWGHATSHDLIRWQEEPCALCPDEIGTIASGSAVLDRKNVSGLGSQQSPLVLLFFSNTGRGFEQHLAYSTDGLQTIQKYVGNPVLPNICAGNRDPRVVWCEDLNKWLMALYMDGDEYWLFSSDDLLHWQMHQQLHLPGDNECPDFYPIMAETGERKWVFSGAHDVYIVGTFQNGLFVAEQSPTQLSYGGLIYASQTFSETWPEVIRISWDMTSNWQCRASQQMGIPTRMTLRRDTDRYRLCAYPVAAFDTLRDSTFSDTSVRLFPEQAYCRKVEAAPTDLLLVLDNSKSGSLNMELFGFWVTLNLSAGNITVGSTTAPLLLHNGTIRLRMIFDRRTLELFIDDGAAVLAAEADTIFSQNFLQLHSTVPISIKLLQISSLQSIWQTYETVL